MDKSEFSETLGLGLEIQDLGCQDRVLVLVLTKFLNQDQSWYWSRLKFSFKTSLGIGLERQKNQDKINTKQGNNEESKNGHPTWLVGAETYDDDF